MTHILTRKPFYYSFLCYSVNNWELGDLRRAINREIGILEAGTTYIDDYVARASSHTGTRPGKRAQPDPRPSYGGKAPRAELKCAFCEGGHKSSDCSTNTDTDSRLKVVKDKRLCFNCLVQSQSTFPVIDV